MPEVVATEELKLDLIRVVCDPNPLFKYQLIYRDGNATGMVGVYSYDEDWYYLYKQDTERYKVKRRKDLEGIEPALPISSSGKGALTNRIIKKPLIVKKQKLQRLEMKTWQLK